MPLRRQRGRAILSVGVPNPTFFVNLQAGFLPSLFTHERNSIGTYVNSAGLVQTASANTPRFTYDASGTCRGLLIEATSQNLLTYSSSFSTTLVWGTTALNTSGWSGKESPDGGTGGFKLVPNTTTNVHSVDRILFGTYLNQYVAISAYVKADGRNYFGIIAGPGTNGGVSFDLVNDTATLYGGGTGAYGTIENLKNGWKRVLFYSKLSITTPSAPRFVVQRQVENPGTTWLGSGTGGVILWGVQFETGYPSSYIPTTTAAVSRDYDYCHCPASYLQYDGNEATICVNFEPEVAGFRYSLLESSYQNYIWSQDGTGLNVYISQSPDPPLSATVGNSDPPIASSFSITGDLYSCLSNGVLHTTSISSTSPAFAPMVDTLVLGSTSEDPDGYNLRGVLKSFRFWNKRMPDSVLALIA